MKDVRPTAQPCSSEVEPKLPPAPAPASEQLFQAHPVSSVYSVSSVCQKYSVYASKVPEAKAKAGKARPVPAHWSQLARLLWDATGHMEPTNSCQQIWSAFRLWPVGLPASAQGCALQHSALGTFLKSNAVYQCLSSMAQEQGPTRCRHPRTHTHTNTV